MTRTAVIVGIDEAGRGPLAGPVVAGACIDCPALSEHPLIRDSKLLSHEQREEVFAWMLEHCTFGVGVSDATYIDSHGILAATERAMQQAVAQIAEKQTPTYLLVDGRDHFWFDYPKSSIIKGDLLERCISAASIAAKVTRDRMLMEWDKEFPQYGFAAHKGYAAPEHIEAIKKHGPCPLHRQTFLRTILAARAAAPVR